MSRNGSGTYSLPVNSWNPANNGTPATAADWQALINDVAAALTQSLSRDGQTVMTGNLQMGSNKLTGLSVGTAAGDSLAWQQLFSQGQPADLASATTTDIGLQNTTVLNITGTTTITSFGLNYNGPRFLRFAGVLTLTHNATTLILPSGANITTAANDCAIVVPSGTPANGWRVVGYMRADGTALVAPSTVPNATNATNVTGGTVSATTGTFSGNVALNGATTTIGDAGTDTALLNAQLSAGGGVGTAGQVLASRGANQSPQWQDDQRVGVNQTWQNLTASRAIGTTYTNNTGRPIQVVFSGGNNANYIFTVQGVTVAQWTQNNSQATVSAIIPNGNTYSVANGSVGVWAELR